jgi:formylglycine-generating enzyme required for sulfatase activity
LLDFQFCHRNTIDNLNANTLVTTITITQKLPNELGLYDMSGHVWGWCSDGYNREYYKNSPIKNPTGSELSSLYVFIVGSWFNSKI